MYRIGIAVLIAAIGYQGYLNHGIPDIYKVFNTEVADNVEYLKNEIQKRNDFIASRHDTDA